MYQRDKAYGVILVLRENGEDRFLILKQKPHGHWSFPKGHGEAEETPKESAIRELKEEAGITDVEFLEVPTIKYGYPIDEGNNDIYHKTTELFIAFAKNDKVIPQEIEISEYKWATYDEAMQTFTFKGTKNVLGIKQVLETAQEYLKNLV